jgi:SAM-dependent methyltransferase
VVSVKVLVAGWFSFEQGHATAGDLLARDLVCRWLDGAEVPFDVANDPPFEGLNWRTLNAEDYTDVVFVCGPFQMGDLEAEFLAKFASCRLFGLDLTMLVPLDRWNPFDFLIERDSSASSNPDITFLSSRPKVPVVGVCLVEPYEGAMDGVAHAAIRRLLGATEAAVVEIDTRLDANGTGLRTAAEVESLLARMDVVVTTRLHGTVLSLKNGVPVVAIDPEAGGAKIRRQAETIGWPVVFNVDEVTDEGLREAFQFCLTEEARSKARTCAEQASRRVEAIQDEFLARLALPPSADRSRVVDDANFGSRRGSAAPSASGLPKSTRSEGVRIAKAIARRTFPASARRLISRAIGWPVGGTISVTDVFARPRRVERVSRCWGYDRGSPVDRRYIESFLARHAADVRGRVLEIGDATYTRRFGAGRVEEVDVLDVSADNPAATIVADLARADHLPPDRFDCIIFTQTLHLIFDHAAAIRTLQRILKPEGVILATFPGISPISLRELPGLWNWNFTSNSATRIFESAFPGGDVRVESLGNALTASAFLYGLAAEDLEPAEFNLHDPEIEMLVAVRAVKAGRRP